MEADESLTLPQDKVNGEFLQINQNAKGKRGRPRLKPSSQSQTEVSTFFNTISV